MFGLFLERKGMFCKGTTRRDEMKLSRLSLFCALNDSVDVVPACTLCGEPASFVNLWDRHKNFKTWSHRRTKDWHEISLHIFHLANFFNTSSNYASLKLDVTAKISFKSKDKLSYAVSNFDATLNQSQSSSLHMRLWLYGKGNSSEV